MKIAVIGATGVVGQTLTTLLHQRGIRPLLFNSQSEISFKEIDLAFFCVKSELAKEWVPQAQKKGIICIDSSSAFRHDPTVPLVIPEINPHALETHQGIIASPNCTTTIMLLPLAPLHKHFQIKRIVAATYQAVSGAGKKGMEELERQTQNPHAQPTVFPHPCAFNVFPHESPLNNNGYVEEEMKMSLETQKILEDPSIGVTARCIRVPVFRAHSEALNVEFEKPFDLEEVKMILNQAPGIVMRHNPTPHEASMQDPVFCGGLRIDPTQKNTLELWVVGDQLLKGAALNMLQIAERLIRIGSHV